MPKGACGRIVVTILCSGRHFPGDLFAEFERSSAKCRRRSGDAIERPRARGAFPKINIGTSPSWSRCTVRIDSAKLAVNVERGLRQNAAFECPPSGSDDGRSAACLGIRSPLVIRRSALAIESVLDIAS